MSWTNDRPRINSRDEDQPKREEEHALRPVATTTEDVTLTHRKRRAHSPMTHQQLEKAATELLAKGEALVAPEDSGAATLAKFRAHTETEHHLKIAKLREAADETDDPYIKSDLHHKATALRHEEGIHYRAHRSLNRDLATGREREHVDHHQAQLHTEQEGWMRSGSD
jgi:hypothetical protein